MPRSAMSLQTQHDPKNEAEISYWNSAGGRRWVERQQSQDIVLGPILQAAVERAQLRQGACVVDIGCSYRCELDRSFFRALTSCFSRSHPALLPICARRESQADASSSPVGASSIKIPGFKCRCAPRLNMSRPGPEDPGAFSFASEQRVHRILADAGFQSVILEPCDFDLDIACGCGIEEALEAATALGPASRALHVSRPQSRQCHRCFRCLRVAAPPFRDANYNQSDERDAIACVMAKACFDQGLFDQGSVG